MKIETKKITFIGMLFSLAIALSFIENFIATFFALPVGVKIGLSNIVVMYALICMGKANSLILVFLKALFAFLTRGIIAGLLSFSGGLISFIVLSSLLFLANKKQYYIFSLCGAISHNLGQLIVISLLLNTSYSLFYAPVLIISGAIMGFITSISLKVLMPVLEKINIGK